LLFQAEDGIRDPLVTGVQTCALPISTISAGRFHTCGLTTDSIAYCWGTNGWGQLGSQSATSSCTNREGKKNEPFACSLRPRAVRSEERRVGKECGYVGVR